MLSPSRKVYLKLLGGIAGLLSLSLGLAVFLFHRIPSQEREPASLRTASGIFEPRSEMPREEIFTRTGIDASRARYVQFHPENLIVNREDGGRDNAHNDETTAILNLFPDTQIVVQFQRPSEYGVNQLIYIGTVEGDTSSKIRLQVEGSVVDGKITTAGREFRIIDAGKSQGLHIVTDSYVR